MLPSSRSPKPYNVHLDETSSYYYFLTNQDLVYICGFENLTPKLTPLVGIYDIEIGEFMFTPQRRDDARHDERVAPTIVELMKSYFTDENHVLVYLCDASDGRPAARQALFIRWHRNMTDMIDHEPVQISVGEVIVYGGMLTRKDFPYKDTMKEQLSGKAVGMIATKLRR